MQSSGCRQAAALRLMADLHAQRGNKQLAENAYQVALQYDPEDRLSLHNLGSLLWEREAWHGAEACFRRLSKLCSETSEPQRYLARLLYIRGEYEQSFALMHGLAEKSLLTNADVMAYISSADRLGVSVSSINFRVPGLASMLADFGVRERLAFALAREQRWTAATRLAKRAPGARLACETPSLSSRCGLIDLEVEDSGTKQVSPLLTETARAVVATYRRHSGAVLVIDRLLTRRGLRRLRGVGLRHGRWRRTADGHETVASLWDGIACPILFQLAEEIRGCLGGHAARQLVVGSIWYYRYFNGKRPPRPHADDGEISVNIWLTATRHNREPKTGGLYLWRNEVPPEYFSAAHEEQSSIISRAVPRASPHQYIGYECNRAVVFHSKSVHQTAPYDFDETLEGRRMNLTVTFI